MKYVTLACFLFNVWIFLWGVSVGIGWGSLFLSLVCAGICFYSYINN